MERNAVRAVIVCGVAVLVCVAGWFGRVEKTAAVSAAIDPAPVIIIDAGHGGFDGGAVGVGGVIEKDINLAVAQKLETMLKFAGYDTVMTRDEDEALGGGSGSTHDKKVADIKYRLNMLEMTPDALFVSIHQNIFGGRAIGTQVFYGPENAESEVLAKILQTNFKALLQPENERQIKRATDDIYILYHATKPAVLVECGFISNSAEAEKLGTAEYQEQLCFVIMSGLAEHMAG